MQLMRTSMRHLRLSKLQKDKLKQGKMWDFTVRGWRPADTEGIEELFVEQGTAVSPQKDISKLEYKDITIDSNPDHLAKWENFQKRNLLRKLSHCLNNVSLTSKELCDASCEKLKKLTDDLDKPSEDNIQKFVIEVPDIPKEFPHQSSNKRVIYPLPISQENQCKTLGMARNLDMFADEFGFGKKKKETFLPLKKSGKDFNLELAYRRFAFLKSMEKHKEQQRILETHLRGDDSREDVVASDDLVLVCEESGSDSSPDDD